MSILKLSKITGVIILTSLFSPVSYASYSTDSLFEKDSNGVFVQRCQGEYHCNQLKENSSYAKRSKNKSYKKKKGKGKKKKKCKANYGCYKS